MTDSCPAEVSHSNGRMRFALRGVLFLSLKLVLHNSGSKILVPFRIQGDKEFRFLEMELSGKLQKNLGPQRSFVCVGGARGSSLQWSPQGD